MNFQAGGESGAFIRTRKQAVMAVRLLMLVVLLLVLRYDTTAKGVSRELFVLFGIFVASNVVLWFVRREKFESRRSYGLIFLFDMGLVMLLAAFLGSRNPEFFAVYFLTVLASAFSNRVSVAALLALGACVIFAALHSYAQGAQSLLTQAFFLRLTLLFISALLAGYIAEAMDAERQIAIHLNPTTGLPGYSLIRTELERRIGADGKFAVCYIDNDNFKAYNDHYGFAKGDRLIKATGEIIERAVRKLGNPDDFVGHVGGDDFLVVTTPVVVEALAGEINRDFALTIRGFYDKSALEKGFIKSHDRKGVTAIFPVMGLSIAVVSNVSREITSPDQVAEIATHLKKKAKSHKSRVYITGDTTIQRTRAQIEAEHKS